MFLLKLLRILDNALATFVLGNIVGVLLVISCNMQGEYEVGYDMKSSEILQCNKQFDKYIEMIITLRKT